MTTNKTKCPYCFEEIDAGVTKCPHCGESFSETSAGNTWHRDWPGRKILGVASAMAVNTRISVNFWRLFFVLTAFLKGAGLVAYLALWAFTPDSPGDVTPCDKTTGWFKSLFGTEKAGSVSTK
ncbi:MAG: PspC domain-containing protein [Candidatus Aminicenantes bacterium]|nr:PspC domain-containing protein [Candidatus Aminicenantes bacterium]